MEKPKIIATASEMSNLVGMYALVIEDKKIINTFYICGKASNIYFICQFISPLDGIGNIAKLFTLEEIKQMVIIPNKEILQEIKDDYNENGWRY